VKRRSRPGGAGPLALAAILVALSAAACDPPPESTSTSRFAAARKQAGSAGASFCDRQWSAGERPYQEIPSRPLPGASGAASASASWRWVNLWATWCLPCVEEMGLLSTWKTSLARDGTALEVEPWSVDDDEARLTEFLRDRPMPGRVRWLRSQSDLPAVLDALGADRSAAIPIHALVDPAGNLRCLRVGAVHDEDYGAVKAIVTGG